MTKLVVGVLFFGIVMRFGLMVLRALARPVPAPPPPGEMRRISLRYRCSSCGVELKMTAAPDQDPPPPRHCMEEMQYVGSRDP
ncbi:MAG: hypothetical protein ACRD1K_10930 [Acidimicrobiales bacterium]